jgi:hypothetical protein
MNYSQQCICNSMADGINLGYKSFAWLLFRHNFTNLAVVVIFNFSFTIRHLFRLTVRYCHAIANAFTLAASQHSQITIN